MITYKFSASRFRNFLSRQAVAENQRPVGCWYGKIMVLSVFFATVTAPCHLMGQAYYIPPADFDGDGHADIMVVTPAANPLDWKWRNKEGVDTGFIHGGAGDLVLPADYDGDGIAERAVFRPSNNNWYVWDPVTGMTSFVLGETGCLPLVGDYDGDGKADAAVLIPTTFLGGVNVMKYRKSSDAGIVETTIGIMGDLPMSGDFDGDGLTDPAVFRRSSRPGESNVFIVQTSGTPGMEVVTELGGYGDIAVCADYTGNGWTDLAVYQQNGTWLILPDGASQPIVKHHGGHTNDIPIPGKYDSDTKADLAVFRDGEWLILRSSSYPIGTKYDLYNTAPIVWGSGGSFSAKEPIIGDWDGDGADDLAFHESNWFNLWRSSSGVVAYPWGLGSDIPTPGDFDGDGIMDSGLFRGSDGSWHRFGSTYGAYGTLQYGYNGIIPVVADYDGDGRADIALVEPSTYQWHLLRTSHGLQTFHYGIPGDVPIPKDYDGDGKADSAVFRPSTSTFYYHGSAIGPQQIQYGDPALVREPIPADYTGDGKADVGVVYINNQWQISGVSNAILNKISTKSGRAVPGDYDGDGKADVAVFDHGTWWILESSSGWFKGKPGPFSFGVGSDVPSGRLKTGYDYDFNQPILFAPFDGTIEDLMGNTTMGVLNGASATSDGGKLNGALILDGTNDFVSIPGYPYLNTSGPYLVRTVSLWFRPDSLQGGRQILYEEGGSGRGFNIYVHNATLYAGGWDLAVDSGIGDQEAWSGSWRQATVAGAGVWHHVTIMFDARQTPTQLTSGVFQAYLDGVEMSGSTQGMQMHTHSDAGALGYVSAGGTRMHDGATTVTNFLAGALDELTIWNRVFDDSTYINGVSEKELFFWMMKYFHHVNVDMDADTDEDGLNHWEELQYGTDPANSDTDGDGLSDWDEIFVHETDPNDPDSDGDGMLDGDEIVLGLDPFHPDNPSVKFTVYTPLR